VVKVEKMKILDMHGETVESLKSLRNQSEKKKVKMKISAVLMCLDGNGVRQIGKLLHIDVQTASRYIKAFNDGGINTLLSYKKSTGRPPVLNEQEQEYCKEVFQLTPEEAGLGINANWNSRIIKEFIEKEFGKKMKKSAIVEMLHRMGFSFTRPTYVLAKAAKKVR
jgi:transposase